MNGWIRLAIWGAMSIAAFYWLNKTGANQPQIGIIAVCFIVGILWVLGGFKKRS